MKHLIICREYPPAPFHPGGIGTYVSHISRLLAESGETVFVISQLWEGAPKKVEEKYHGRLIIYRVPLEDRNSLLGQKINPSIKSKEARGLFESDFYPQCFSWQASLFAENLVEKEGIDVVEAQEFEAPLYYFQIRRALGLGPSRKPPCIIHLHSPMEFIVRYNDWDINHPYFLTAKRLEDYSIATADALLCPSHYLAHQAEVFYGLPTGSIQVIPLPMGDSPELERDKDTWECGTICYIGRLERRKGIIEWIDAATTIAHAYPAAHFEFIGANTITAETMSGEEFVRHRIPEELRERFCFLGPQNRSSLPQFLSKARMAVVPSRWENFPNTCVEAMSSGLPVIASRKGGMAEMIEDGKTGWLANRAGSDGLAEALKRALETPPARVAEMGHTASLSIRQMCDNKKILESHLRFRRQTVCQEPKRSLYLPTNLSWVKRLPSDTSTRRVSKSSTGKGIALVISCFNSGKFLNTCLQNIQQQTQKPAAIIIVDDASTEQQTINALNKAKQEGWHVIHNKSGNYTPAKNAGIDALLKSEPNLLGFCFLNARDRLGPNFIATCERVLQHCPEVGLVSCWIQHYGANNKIWIKPCPCFPYQWLSNEVAPFSVIRAEALRESGNFRSMMNQEYENWDLFNGVMDAGWTAVTVPEILGDYHTNGNSMFQILRTYSTYGKMRRELLNRFSDVIAKDVQDIILLAEFNTAGLLLEMNQTISRHHQGIAYRILRKLKKKLYWCTPLWISNLLYRMAS